MTKHPLNTVSWFEVASDDPDAVQRFYGELFGWRFQSDPEAAAGGIDYRGITYPGDDAPRGGVFGTKGRFPNHAVFSVAVHDVTATCEKVESLGGKVIFKMIDNEAAPDFAYFHDTSGNLFGVFGPMSE